MAANQSGGQSGQTPAGYWFIAAILFLGGAVILAFGLLTWSATPTHETKVHDVTVTTVHYGPSPLPSATPLSTRVDKTTTTTNPDNRRSDSITLAILSLGALLVLCGAFFPRISGITLPGGAGIQLSAPAAAQLLRQVMAKAQEHAGVQASPDKLTLAYQYALERVHADSARGTAKQQRSVRQRLTLAPPLLDPDYVDAVADEAVQRADANG